MDRDIRILILEDSDADAELMEREVRKAGLAFTSRRTDSHDSFLSQIKEFSPDIILADYNLPAFDGISALAIAKRECPDVPFIFVSGAIGEELAIDTLRSGAKDYVLKDKLSKLAPAVNRALAEFEERMGRKKAENRLVVYNRKLRMLTHCNEILIHAKAEMELLRQICQAIIYIGEYPMAWIGFMQNDKEKTVLPIVHAGYEQRYLKNEKISWAESESGQSPIGKAIRTARPVVTRGIADDPRYFPFREEALKRGCGSAIAIPLVVSNQTIGVLNIYANEPDSFDDGEMQLLVELANDLAYGIMTLRTRIERDTMQRDLVWANKELVKSNKELKRISLIDQHTGLYNHRYIVDAIELEFDKAKRYVQPFSVILLDIDYFKSINNVYGHRFGDLVLKQFAEELKKKIPKYDMISRYGGEEFIVACPHTSRLAAVSLAQSVLNSIVLHKFGNKKSTVKLKLSGAISSYPEDNIAKSVDLIGLADKILEKAKEGGGNRVYSTLDISKDKIVPDSKETGDITDMGPLKERLSALAKKASQNLIESIFAFAKTIELKDYHTGVHVARTVRYATEIAKALGLAKEEIEAISKAAILHDLGKLGIDEKLLNKRARLTKKEFDKIKRHPQIGIDIIRPIQALHDIIPFILYHHERWDGKGYPAGLKGEEIPMGARIISVADAYQALVSRRPYRKAYSKKEAMKIIGKESGTKFDPKIVETFLNILRKRK